MAKIRMYADGGSRGNPGPSAGAAVLFEITADGSNGKRIAEAAKYLGVATNNQAEYTGIIEGLKKALELGYTEVDVCLDSELAVKQLNREYKVKNPDLAQMFLQVHNLSLQFKSISFRHVRREFNSQADKLVNDTLDAHTDTPSLRGR